MVSRTFIQGIYEFLTDFFLLCFLGGRIFDCNQKIQKSHYFILAKKYTLQHLKFMVTGLGVSVFWQVCSPLVPNFSVFGSWLLIRNIYHKKIRINKWFFFRRSAHCALSGFLKKMQPYVGSTVSLLYTVCLVLPSNSTIFHSLIICQLRMRLVSDNFFPFPSDDLWKRCCEREEWSLQKACN